MTPIQQLLLGVGASEKTYLDELFSNYLYTGTATSNATDNATTQSINNGIDLSATGGGMVWIKSRDDTHGNEIFDTTRGILKDVRTNKTNAEDTVASSLTAFNNNGFSIGDRFAVNENDEDYVSYTFKKQEKFFTIKQYSGTGSAQSLSHDLGSVPGLIVIKRTDSSDNWNVYHRSTGEHNALFLNGTGSAEDDPKFWNDTVPTSTTFTVGDDSGVNDSSGTYIAYIFAGGESTASEAVSVNFERANGDYLSTGSSSSDFSMGTGDFTIECWWKPNHPTNNEGVFHLSPTANGLSTSFTNSLAIGHDASTFTIYGKNTDNSFGMARKAGQWHHIAYVRSSGVSKVYVNGIEKYSTTDTTDYAATYIAIGGYYNTSYVTDGNISNFRVVKGTAVYTSSFRPPTEPLTNITNTVLLCCNNSSTTGKTVGPTLTANGSPNASTDSPFDDPAGFAFGPNSDQNLIKCGSYSGTSNDNKITLPFEPQWLLLKVHSRTEGWVMFDSMRGLSNDADSLYLEANASSAENTFTDYISLQADGFTVKGSHNAINASGENYLYIAIAAETGRTINSENITAGSDVFAMDTGAGSATIPNFDSGFVVDMSINRQPATSQDWYLSARLIQKKYLKISEDNQLNGNSYVFDSNVGWDAETNRGSGYQSWMFKRHAGFDCLIYGPSTGTATSIPHQLGQIPEMIWVKVRDGGSDTYPWTVYHKGLNGGTDPEKYSIALNEADAESQSGTTSNRWNDTAPSASHFSVGPSHWLNSSNGHSYIAMLFASVKGVSAVGYWTGTGSTQTITLPDGGFQPRFLMWKRANAIEKWYVVDTLRGWQSSANDQMIQLNSSNVQFSSNLGDISSTGFTVTGGENWQNNSGDTYIYYCHA